jgi:phospholipase C
MLTPTTILSANRLLTAPNCNSEAPMSAADSQHRFDHVVAIMFENRSFDNLLGYLYQPGEVPAFEGVVGRDLANPVPPDVPNQGMGSVSVHVAKNLDTPDPDPGEEFPHINTQLFATVEPPRNRFSEIDQMSSPFNAPSPPPISPPMSGFVQDYVNSYRVEMGRWPSYEQYAQIMACYTPEQLPVLSALAKGFGCFDHWFCEVPSQTYTNRSFFHAASSSGFVVNGPPGKFATLNDAPTIFERLEKAGRTWQVYIDPAQILSATGLIHARRLAQFFATHFSTIYDFYDDARKGTLPDYSFIEPNMFHPHTDMHPPLAGRIREELHLPAPDSIIGGERLLADVYDAVRTSSSSSGSNYANTLLLVTFDEHGGTYDHVPPPDAPTPYPAGTPGEMGFRFDRSGVRIPTIAISAWIDPNTVISQAFRSTSLIRTLRERWSLGGPLTQRDAVAPDLAPLLTRQKPRPPEEWPTVRAPSPTLFERVVAFFDRPLEALERDTVGEALAHEAASAGRTSSVNVATLSHREADAHAKRIGAAFFPKVIGGRQS